MEFFEIEVEIILVIKSFVLEEMFQSTVEIILTIIHIIDTYIYVHFMLH